jgi:hypothetical protein
MARNQPKHGAYNIIPTVRRVTYNKHTGWFSINTKVDLFYFIPQVSYSMDNLILISTTFTIHNIA